MKLPQLIGIAGTNGAGKDTLGELLAERCGYKFLSVSDILREELTRQGLPHERENTRELSTRWAREFGPAVLSLKTIAAYEEEKEQKGYKGLAIGSIRRPAEAKAIQDRGGIVVWIDADRRDRYDRIRSRGRSETDVLTFEEWAKQEDIEMTPPEGDDGSAMNMAGVRDIADIHIDNSHESFETYRAHLIKEYEL